MRKVGAGINGFGRIGRQASRALYAGLRNGSFVPQRAKASLF